ncbi:MAG: YidC/Oxa1 family membrane protein insertase [Candidatus Saccharibacteria bacterium]|nr:MAG: YidC/Oxa1 family membrane protein insertase [Candidatus Saccharibacteria bacterium]
MNIFDILIVQPIFNLLIGLYSIIPGGDFGISLIIFTVLVRFAMYPLVKKQLHQTQAIKKIQPELARIKKQAKGNKQLESMQMLELYKKNGINPFRSIGLLLIQLPIFIALYSVIQIFTLHRDQIAKFSYDFMEGIGPIKQVIEHPEQFNEKLLGVVDLTKSAFTTNGVDIFLVFLAVIAAVTQYIMSKQTMPQNESKKRLRDVMSEAAEGKQADQSEMNAIVMSKMMKVLPFFMFFIMITVPGALALYYAVSNIVAVAQQSYLLKKDAEEMDEIADEPVAKPKAGKKATAKAREKAAKPAKVTKSTPTVTRIKAKDSKTKARK